jgi:iron complex transport system substrate-binding protein
MKKKIIFVLFSLLLASSLLFAEGQKENSYIQKQQETKIFVDSLGREVEVPTNIERVAPSGNLSQQIIYSIVPDEMVGWGSRPTAEMQKYFKQEVVNRPVYGAFYGKKANLNMEALLVADPQVVVDIGEIKGSVEEMTKDLDDLQAKLNIPVVFIASYLDDMGSTYRALGDLLNKKEAGEERAEYCDQTVNEAKEVLATISEDTKPTIYYGTEQDGLTSFPKGSFHTQVFPLVGVNNIVEGKGNSIKVSPEQLIIWDPEYIILTGEGGYESFLSEDSPFKDLKAIKENHIFVIPEGPFNWIDRPPAMNRVLGMKWLGNLIYPDKFNYDIKQEAKTFYSLFYNYDLSDQELDELLKNSTR